MLRRTMLAVVIVAAAILVPPSGASAREGRLGKHEAYEHVVRHFDLAHSRAAVTLLHRFDARPALDAVVFPSQPVAMARLGRRAVLAPAMIFVNDGVQPWKENCVDVTLLVRERLSGRKIVRVVR
jgi:hypothetical protein